MSTQYKLDGELIQKQYPSVELTWENETFFQVKYNNKVYRGEVISNQIEAGFVTVKINHRVAKINKVGPLDELIAAMGLDTPKVRKLKQLKAPMPGRVVGISVEVGQAIHVGDPLLTLEAMKMENVLKAEGEGVVKEIVVQTQDVVEKGAVLIHFD